MITQQELYDQLITLENLELAFTKAKKGKTLKPYVIEFEQNLQENLAQLRKELQTFTYQPRPLQTFILRDPKTRKISKSDFRDRVIHHAICNIIEPLFDKAFIHDSFANRLGKGTYNAIKRFKQFMTKVSKNNKRPCFILKADVKHYFDTVDHTILLNILSRKVSDERVLWLIGIILANHKTPQLGKGMPLGNLTSQFFANVYLNELDRFAKYTLKAKYYIRYVDDFVILHHSYKKLTKYKHLIDSFLRETLALTLHPDKSKILTLHNGVGFLGFRIFSHHKLVRKTNMHKFERKFNKMKALYHKGGGEAIREQFVERLQGWLAYIKHANTYKYRRDLIKRFNYAFPLKSTTVVTNHRKHKKNIQKFEQAQT